MATTCLKRLRKELSMLEKNADEFIDLHADANDIRQWTATIRAPPDSVFDGFKFDVAIECATDYPLTPPKMTFITRIFHPNVYFDTGEICLDILKKEWSPAWSLQSACRAIMTLLAEPAADSPLNCDAGNMIRTGDLRAFKSVARMYCHEFAHVCAP
jgi:peroxin-4